MKYCGECGHSMNNDALFCPECGTQSGATAPLRIDSDAPSRQTTATPKTPPMPASQKTPVRPAKTKFGSAPPASPPRQTQAAPSSSFNDPHRGNKSNRWLLAVCIVLGVLLVGIGVYMLLQKRSQERDEAEEIRTNYEELMESYNSLSESELSALGSLDTLESSGGENAQNEQPLADSEQAQIAPSPTTEPQMESALTLSASPEITPEAEAVRDPLPEAPTIYEAVQTPSQAPVRPNSQEQAPVTYGYTQTPSPVAYGIDPIFDQYGFVFDDSDRRYLTRKELLALTNYDSNMTLKEILGFARNEIFARHGNAFQTTKYHDHYSRYDWYNGFESYYQVAYSDFNKYEIANCKLIISIEDELK